MGLKGLKNKKRTFGLYFSKFNVFEEKFWSLLGIFTNEMKLIKKKLFPFPLRSDIGTVTVYLEFTEQFLMIYFKKKLGDPTCFALRLVNIQNFGIFDVVFNSFKRSSKVRFTKKFL